MTYFAHTKTNDDGELAPQREWELLYTGPCQNNCSLCQNMSPGHGHLNKVAHWTARFADALFDEESSQAAIARDWGFLIGLWHDVGKYSREFQDRLRGERKRVDHSTAGAQYLSQIYTNPPLGQLLAYLVAGHHAGLADWNRNGSESDLYSRLNNAKIPEWKSHAPKELKLRSDDPSGGSTRG